jgi:cobalt/nickel transport protein
MKRLITLVCAAFLVAMAVPAFAHFQMLYTPEMNKMGKLEFKIVFCHPAESGHVMKMDKPEQFFVINKEKKTDLLGTIKPVKWTSAMNQRRGLRNHLQRPRRGLRVRPGSGPVLREGRGHLHPADHQGHHQRRRRATDWDKPVGLKTEWVPYDRPYALYPGMTFRPCSWATASPCPTPRWKSST